jgi:periplasmic protein CpxP/Spy
MTKFKKTILAAVAVATIGVSAVVAYAQAPAPGGPPGPDAMRGRFMTRMCDDIDARANGRLAYLETRLAITAQQRDAWTAFANAARAATGPIKQACAAPRPTGALDMAQRMELMERFMAAGLEALRAVRPAVVTLNAALTEEQRTRFNNLFDGRMMGRGRM